MRKNNTKTDAVCLCLFSVNFIAGIFRELVLFYPRSLLEGHVLVAKKVMESANIIHPISHELLT